MAITPSLKASSRLALVMVPPRFVRCGDMRRRPTNSGAPEFLGDHGPHLIMSCRPTRWHTAVEMQRSSRYPVRVWWPPGLAVEAPRDVQRRGEEGQDAVDGLLTALLGNR